MASGAMSSRPPTRRLVRYCRSPSPTKVRVFSPGTSSVLMPPASRLLASSRDFRSAFSFSTCAFWATVRSWRAASSS